MIKKAILICIVLLIVSGALYAQNQDRAKNAFSLTFGVIGAELNYERMFNRHLSVLADVSYTTLIFMDEFTVSGKGRWYPCGRAFFFEMGLGYSYGRGVVGFMGEMLLTIFTFGWYLTVMDTKDDVFRRSGGFLIQPALGWKIDIGKRDGFVLPITMGLNIKTGKMPDLLPYLRIGVGYAF